jgi:hypothetical protein
LSYILEWQLVAHAPETITPAQGAVATAIARRIPPGKVSIRIPQRTLLAEAVGVNSKRTIQRALVELQILGVIGVQAAATGSRKPDLVSWRLECPEGCQIDHINGNTKISASPKEATRPNPDTSTRPNPDTPLRSSNKREIGILGFIEKGLESVETKSEAHLEIIAALADPEQKALIRQRAELLSLKAEQSPENYLAQIAISSPRKLLPKPPKAQEPPNLSHLPRELQESRLRAWERDQREQRVS